MRSGLSGPFLSGMQTRHRYIIHSTGQGKKKSMFWEMFASRPFFSDSAQTSDKDFLLNTYKCWLYELAEIESVTTVKGIAALKGVLSNAVDNFRPT